MGYYGLDKLALNTGTCPFCHNSGNISIQTWTGKQPENHCNNCGCSWPRKLEAT